MKTKNSFTNRILSLVLALVMVVSMLPGAALTTHAAEPIKLSGNSFTENPGEGFTFEVYGRCRVCNAKFYTYSNIDGHSIEITNFTYSIEKGKVSINFSYTVTGCEGTFTDNNVYNSGYTCTNRLNDYLGSSVGNNSNTCINLYVKRNATAHQGDATCKTAANCTLCGTSYTNSNNHEKPDEFTYSVNTSDSTKHDKKYACCGKVAETVAHSNCTYSVSGNVITETCPNGCGHSATATLVYNTGSGTYSYTGSAIEPLTVKYSDGWQGGTLEITYQNNTAVSTDTNKAIGSIEKDGAEATQSFDIIKAAMTGITVNGYSGEYDGNAHSISITGVPTDAEVTYSTSANGTYTENNPSYTQAGTYTVWYKIEKANYELINQSAAVTINPKPITVTANDASKAYGDDDPTLTYSVADSTPLVTGESLSGITVSREGGENVGEYTISASQTDGANPNYKITFVTGTFTIDPRVIEIQWSNTEIVYDGTNKLPTATVKNLVTGDTCTITVTGEQTEANTTANPTCTATAASVSNSNYVLPENKTTTFVIKNASQAAPTTVVGVAETYKGKGDGKLTNLEGTMEFYAAQSESDVPNEDTVWTAVPENTTVIDYRAAGIYYVRYAAKTNYNASEPQIVTVGDGEMLKIVVPQNPVGYTVAVKDNTTEIEWQGEYTFTVTIADGYTATENFAIYIGEWNTELAPNKSHKMSGAVADQVITVQGVEDITPPAAEIALATSKWNTFLNSITFGLFFKETQSVTVNAEDVNTGSGLDKVYYYLATEELTEESVKALAADWTEYTGAFNIDPNKEYIIYAKAVDKAGNATYVSSNGIVLDAIAPVINGVEDGGTYYGNTQFSLDETYMDTVTVDGNPVELTDGKYTITADGKEHTIVVTDKAGNDAKKKITVIAIASLDDTIETIKTADVKSSDKEDIQEVLDFVNILIESGKDFTDEEDQQLSDMKSNAESLLKQIDDVATATDTDNTEKVKDVTDKTVTPEDKTDLEKAKADLEKALEDNSGNYTEDEKKAIEDEIKRIDDALEVIGNVEAVEELIEKLPENITKNDEAAIKAADDAYNALNDYEKSLVDKGVKKALDDAKAALAELNKPADTNSPATGDNSNMFLWIILLFISGAVIILIVVDRKRKAARK